MTDLLTIIGGLLLGWVIGQLLLEIVRAARQSHRIITVLACEGHGRKPSWRAWWRVFRSEAFSEYDSLIIFDIEIPRDPSRPMRRERRG